MNTKKFLQRFVWYLACGLNRLAWHHTIGIGLLALWVTLIAMVDSPLRSETRQMASHVTDYLTLEPTKPRSTTPHSAGRDLTHEFVATLPEFDKYSEQLRALNLLANKSGVIITRIDYRYEPMPTLPIKKLTLHMDISGDETQQRAFLRTALNAFANLSIARLAYTKRVDGVSRLEQKLDVNLYYQLRPKANA